ncbi:adenylate kinase [Granulicella sp. dw_53]|uniref:adenylate kinase n=1 Tax=Granulicella sp. dw_53 TaxID=2719792 RepID=UPI001BD22DF8|nr:adenylate kinase [Granulicella sp. dw_53]
MQRVLILGCPGSGKSTLARTLSTRMALPLIHLDQLYWSPGWVEPERHQWQQQIAEVLANPSWIIDGNYGGTVAMRLAAADTAILLDLPRSLCLRRALQRILLSWGRVRSDMAKGCPERLEWSFLSYIWNFHKKLPELRAQLQAFPGRVTILRSPREVQAFLNSFVPNSKPDM